MPTSTDKIQDNLAKIQGNIIGGFNKDYQTFLFLKFNDPNKGRKWIGQIVTEIATSEEVKAFNDLFKAVRHRSGREGVIKATWTNIAFTHSGLKVLGISNTDLDLFPEDFKAGLAARAAGVGDTGNSAPEKWARPLGSKDIHALLIVASDSLADLGNLVDAYINDPTFSAAATVIFRQEGRTRVEDPGHEHFGFKDGVSQPGIRGVTKEKIDSKTGEINPDKGPGNEDLLHPGEFVLGYPTQIPTPKQGVSGPNPDPGEISKSGPDWTKNGSYLVFRRLSQNVQAFRNSVHELAKATGLDSAVLGAKLVGRYESGAPLEKTDEQEKKGIDPTLKDPSIDDPGLLKDERINDFEFGNDPQGQFVPRAAHIRKTYPRDQEAKGGLSNESDTQTHRLLRRGIAFGNSLGAAEHGGANDEFPHDRGLLFLAYQKSIADQFEFVQSAWVNNPDFPENGDGEDPIIAQSPEGGFQLPPKEGSGCPVHNLSVQHFVTTTGGEYFFQPSIDAIYLIAGETQHG